MTKTEDLITTTNDLIEQTRDDLTRDIQDAQARILAEMETLIEENLATKQQISRIERNIGEIWQYMSDLKKETEKNNKAKGDLTKEKCPECNSEKVSDCIGGTCLESDPKITKICQNCLNEW